MKVPLYMGIDGRDKTYHLDGVAKDFFFNPLAISIRRV